MRRLGVSCEEDSKDAYTFLKASTPGATAEKHDRDVTLVANSMGAQYLGLFLQD